LLFNTFRCVYTVSTRPCVANRRKLLNGAADVMAEVWVGHELAKRHVGPTDKTRGHKGDQWHHILWRLHTLRGLLEETSGMHVWEFELFPLRMMKCVCEGGGCCLVCEEK